MTTALTYVIKFVDDMDAAVRFHAGALGLPLRFQSPEWTEFETGSTTLALHAASSEHPSGTCELGLQVDDVERFYAERIAEGVEAIEPPSDLHGMRIAKLRAADGGAFSVSGPPASHG
jgi:catechol 2,3-dioxygenase-like lactoylglutathione lyase family enzyme